MTSPQGYPDHCPFCGEGYGGRGDADSAWEFIDTYRRAIRLAVVFIVVAAVVAFFAGRASADVFEVEFNANRDGWARLHAEGLWVDRDPALGRYSVMSSRGKPTIRRVRVEKGANTIRVHALRWEDMDIYAEMARWPFGDPARPVNPVVPASVNAAFVWGRVAGRDFERTLQPSYSSGIVGAVPGEE